MEQTLILIHCTDAVGLVSSIAHVLAGNELNITTMREYVDESTKRFFSRIVCSGKVIDAPVLTDELRKVLPKGAQVSVNPRKKKSLAILVTKEPHCLGDILVRYFFNTLDAEISCVIGNYDTLREFTERFNVPFHYVSHEGKSKDEFEKELHRLIYSYNPDYVVLAKFMRILSPIFVAHYQGKIINIHHSFLPAFMGANPYQQAYTRGVKIIGATAHFVTDDLDEGPIIAQDIKPVNHTYTAEVMRKAGKEIEKAVLIKALSLIIEDRVFVTGNKTVVFE